MRKCVAGQGLCCRGIMRILIEHMCEHMRTVCDIIVIKLVCNMSDLYAFSSCGCHTPMIVFHYKQTTKGKKMFQAIIMTAAIFLGIPALAHLAYLGIERYIDSTTVR